jgi:hypothetical protein
MPEVVEWKFERGDWLQVYQLPERAGSGSFTLAVSDIEDEVRKIGALGIDVNQRSSSKMVKTLIFPTQMAITSPSRRRLIRQWRSELSFDYVQNSCVYLIFAPARGRALTGEEDSRATERSCRSVLVYRIGFV